MTSSISTKDNPVKFFKDFFLDGGFEKEIENFRSYCISKATEAPSSNKYREGYGEISIYFEGESTFSDHFTDNLNTLLYRQFEISKNLLLDSIPEKYLNLDSFLTSQKIILKQITESKTKLFDEYPVCKKYFDLLLEHINKLSSENNGNIQVESNNFKVEIVESPEELIKEIFGYLKGKNVENLKIMSDSEHERLIKMITVMVKTESKPKIDRKFTEVKIPKALLRYTFYVLHNKLYGLAKREYYIEFMHESFKLFEGLKYDTLKRKFSEPPSTPKFVPGIIRMHKMKME